MKRTNPGSGGRNDTVSRVAITLHVASLATAGVIVLRVNRGQWFFGDEWDFLAQRGLGHGLRPLFVPHSEHWTTIPILAYRALYSVFGLRTYVPYVFLLVALHLLAAHLLWRVMRRVGVAPLIGTALVGVFAVLGSGSENLLWAFQVTFIGSLALGLAHLLLVDHSGPFGRRDMVGWLLATAALMFSGTAVTMVAVVGLTVALRRGVKLAMATISVPALVYMAWLYWAGSAGLSSHETNRESLLRVPNYVWSGLVNALDRSFGAPGIGPVILVGLGAWLLQRSELSRGEAAPAVAAAMGAVVLFVVIGVGRSALGPEQSASPRYVYVAFALLMPALGLAMSAITAALVTRQLVLCVLLGMVAAHNLSQLRSAAIGESKRELPVRNQILAAARLLDEGALVVSALPEPTYSPNLTAAALSAMKDEDKLPRRVRLSEFDRLAAATALQVGLAEGAVAPLGNASPVVVSTSRAVSAVSVDGCTEFSPSGTAPEVTLVFSGPSSIRLHAVAGGELVVSLHSTGLLPLQGPPRTLVVPPGLPRWLSVSREAGPVTLKLPPDGPIRLCEVQVSR